MAHQVFHHLNMEHKLTYLVRDAAMGLRELRLTLMAWGGSGMAGLAAQRREMLLRLVAEARLQGAKLTYSDLSVIMLSSRATLKRDVGHLRSRGHEVPIGREFRRNDG